MDQSASANQSSSTQAQPDSSQIVGGQASGGASAQGSASTQGGSASAGATEDKKTGLDRADQVAGEHGKHGRDNAREKQGSQ